MVSSKSQNLIDAFYLLRHQLRQLALLSLFTNFFSFPILYHIGVLFLFIKKICTVTILRYGPNLESFSFNFAKIVFNIRTRIIIILTVHDDHWTTPTAQIPSHFASLCHLSYVCFLYCILSVKHLFVCY